MPKCIVENGLKPQNIAKNGQRGLDKLATRIDASPKLDFSVDQRGLKNLLKKTEN